MSVFSYDSKFNDFLNKAANLIILNLLWILCSLPLVTIGASTTALYYNTLKLVRNEDTYIVQSFFRCFRENFRQSCLIWLIMTGAAGLLGFDFYVSWYYMPESMKHMLIYPFIILAFLFLAAGCYVFPMIAFFENSTKKVLKNSFRMLWGTWDRPSC